MLFLLEVTIAAPTGGCPLFHFSMLFNSALIWQHLLDFKGWMATLLGFCSGVTKALPIWVVLFMFFSKLVMKETERRKNLSATYILSGY